MDQAAWLILAVIFAGIFSALVQGGWTRHGGVLDWFRAKFLGQTTHTAAKA